MVLWVVHVHLMRSVYLNLRYIMYLICDSTACLVLYRYEKHLLDVASEVRHVIIMSRFQRCQPCKVSPRDEVRGSCSSDNDLRERRSTTHGRHQKKNMRKPNASITRQIIRKNPQGTRNRRRHKNTWHTDLKVDIKLSGLTWKQMERKARFRKIDVVGSMEKSDRPK